MNHAGIAQQAVHGLSKSRGVGSTPAVRSIPDDDSLPLEFRGIPQSLDEARDIKHRFFWAEGPCPKGHPGPHYTKNMQCVVCARAWARSRAKRYPGAATRVGMIGNVKGGQPFVHILGDWSPVMVNIGPLLAVRRDEAEAPQCLPYIGAPARSVRHPTVDGVQEL